MGIHERFARLSLWMARLALRGRHAVELTHSLTHKARTTLDARQRRLHTANFRLEACAPSRRLAVGRTRLATAQERLSAATIQRRQRLERRLADVAGRLQALSPLGVLARGYAVCWIADQSAIVRDASEVSLGDHLAVTLHQGQLTCTVIGKDPDQH